MTSQLSEMTPREWVQFLADQKLSKIVCHNGSIQYARVEDNPHGRKHTAVATNGWLKIFESKINLISFQASTTEEPEY